MENNNALDQNPEKVEMPDQEENSDQQNDTGEEMTEPSPVKKKPAGRKKAAPAEPLQEEPVPDEQPDAEEKTEVEPSPAEEQLTAEAQPVAEEPQVDVAPGDESPAAETEVHAPAEESETVPEEKDTEPVEAVVEEDDSGEALPAENTGEEQPAAGTAETVTADAGDAPVEDHEDEEEEEDEEEHDDHEEDLKVNYHGMSLEELVTLLEQIVSEEDISSMRKKVALIKVAFLQKQTARQEEELESIAGKEEDEEEAEEAKDDLQTRFDHAFQVYSEKRKSHLEQQEEEKQKNLEAKKLILEELKALIESEESLKKTYDDFKELQEKWKSIGMIPKSEVNNLWQNYHFYVEKFFDKVKINKELRDLDLKKNLELKIELCEKAEELLLETSILKSFKQLQQYHKQWKEIGPVPQDKKDELWDRFRNTTEKINQARRDHYTKLKEEQETNLVSKMALCEKAEEVLQRENNSIKDWQENTREISELLKMWKTIGPAPRTQNDEIWERFKTSLDTFFAGKKEHFQTIKDEQVNNYNLKLGLCAQAEALKSSTDWKETTRDLINLQKEWKKIGPVPRKYSDKIWHRFRAACDEFFNSKSEYFANRKTHETDNLKAKEDLIRKVEEHTFGKDRSENLEVLKEFQREWTEIGHVPFRDKEKVQNAFRNAINNRLDELKISKAEMQTITYRQRFENIKENPNANRIVRNERHFLVQKMKKLEEEIQLLENNMGFLAKSKKADLLKAEFMKKIENTRTEVEVLREKIKFLERETD